VKTLTSTEFKAKCLSILDEVAETGEPVTILKRGKPVAQLVPYDAERPLEVRRASRKPGDLRLPPPLARPTDSLSTLLQDRSSR